MALERYIRHESPVYWGNAIQDSIARAVDPIIDKPQMDTLYYEDVELLAGVENWLEHGLGRKVRGWRLEENDTPALVYRVTASSADLTKFLPLAASSNSCVKITVF